MKKPRVRPIAMRFLVNGFIIFHLIAFACWANPLNAKYRNGLVISITPYMRWTGLWQSWEMFAPDPSRLNAHLEALIVFRDGSQTIWAFPRMDKLGYFERYVKERYGKWSLEYLRLNAYASLWPDTARYLARLYYNPSNPPREVQLRRFWKEIPPPVPGSNHQPLPKEHTHDQSYTFFTYQPTEEDFA